jgi:hypothetical protein
MKHNRVISTAVLFLLLGTTLPAFAQKGQKEKGGGGGKAQQAQRQQQPQRAQQVQHQQQPQRAQQAQHTQQAQRGGGQHTQEAQHAQRTQHTQQAQRGRQQGQRVAYNRGNNGNHYGRIPDDRYRSHFGRDHRFRMIRPTMIGGYNRFQYGGYWFGFNEGWPVGWDYNDDVYVEYVGGAYYLYNPRHSGIHITLNLF